MHALNISSLIYIRLYSEVYIEIREMRLSGSRSWSVVGALTRGRSKQQYSILIRSRTFNITPASVISSPQYTFDTSNRWLSSSKHGHVVEHHPHYPNHHHPLQQTADANNIHDLIESWQYTYRIPINTIFQAILEDKSYQEVVKSKMLDTSNWENFANNSRRVLVKDPYHFFHQSNEKVIDMKHRLESAFININIDEVGTSSSSFQACKDYLFQIILSRAEVELHEIIKANHVLAQTSDLSLPHEWYPYARLTKRKIIYHGGPTNSGKVSQDSLLRLVSAAQY